MFIFSLLRFVYEYFIPHFITEDVAMIADDEGQLKIVCPLEFIDIDDYYEYVGTIKAFTWFDQLFFIKYFNVKPA